MGAYLTIAVQMDKYRRISPRRPEVLSYCTRVSSGSDDGGPALSIPAFTFWPEID
jgi:hypothetical protein